MSQNTCGTAPRRHLRENDSISVNSSRIGDISEWEANEAMRQRELEEARVRASQMEKTMRWWSDCTANWREKWSKVRTERNKVREDCKQLQTKLEEIQKDLTLHKQKREEIEIENQQLKQEIETLHDLIARNAEKISENLICELNDTQTNENESKEDSVNENGIIKTLLSGLETKALNFQDAPLSDCTSKGAVPKYLNEFVRFNKGTEYKIINGLDLKDTINDDPFSEDLFVQKMSVLQIQLDEAKNNLEFEKEENKELQLENLNLKAQMQELNKKCDELSSKKSTDGDLQSIESSNDLLSDTQNDDSAKSEEDIRYRELQSEIDTLTCKKQALEKENKKLRSELRKMQEKLDSRNRSNLYDNVNFEEIQELIDKKKVK